MHRWNGTASRRTTSWTGCSDWVAVGEHAEEVVAAERLDHQLGPITEPAELAGAVVLLQTDHSSNTTIHLAEQQVGRGRFYRYALDGTGLWVELAATGEARSTGRLQSSMLAAVNIAEIYSETFWSLFDDLRHRDLGPSLRPAGSIHFGLSPASWCPYRASTTVCSGSWSRLLH